MSAAHQEVLGEVSTEALMAEVQRRIECAKKPERRTIFIGPRKRNRAQTTRMAGVFWCWPERSVRLCDAQLRLSDACSSV
jgi:hypothetical protein